jgi:hypothetical protein
MGYASGRSGEKQRHSLPQGGPRVAKLITITIMVLFLSPHGAQAYCPLLDADCYQREQRINAQEQRLRDQEWRLKAIEREAEEREEQRLTDEIQRKYRRSLEKLLDG